MTNRYPTARAFANSTAKMSILYRGKTGARTFEVSPALAGSCVALALVAGVAAIGASVYVFSRDDVMRSLLSGQARMQYAYEDRIAQLRAHVDRVAGRQLIDQDTVETRLQELISRQVQLESRQALVARLADDAAKAGIRISAPPRRPGVNDATITGSITPGVRPGMALPFAAPQGLSAPKPQPEGAAARPEPLDRLRTDSVSMLPLPAEPRAIPSLLDQAEVTARTAAAEQIAALRGLEMKAEASTRRLRAMVDMTGLDKSRFAKALPKAIASGIGGPLLPMTGSEATVFERSLAATQNHLREQEGLARVVRALPIRRPLPKAYETSSTFGGRMDPFTRGYAMHSGLDFRASTGTPARATGDGKVVQADWVGGYGRMVEIDHGFGLTTRYAHLSHIDVAEGDVIKTGQTVGLVGSTGRSTGPHLHYEVRIDEEAVDPVTFVRAGERAGAE